LKWGEDNIDILGDEEKMEENRGRREEEWGRVGEWIEDNGRGGGRGRGRRGWIGKVNGRGREEIGGRGRGGSAGWEECFNSNSIFVWVVIEEIGNKSVLLLEREEIEKVFWLAKLIWSSRNKCNNLVVELTTTTCFGSKGKLESGANLYLNICTICLI